MLYAGISWDATGYDVAVLGAHGEPARPPTRFPAGQLIELIGWLHGLHAAANLAVVIDSGNGVLDGTLTAAGLAVYRADPWQVPAGAGLGSPPARALAEAALPDLAGLARLTPATGTLAGRGDDFERGIAESRSMLHRLTRAGGAFAYGSRERPRVCLTFDDGPHPVHTPRMLEILGRYGVPATFFLVGLHARGFPALAGRLAAAGHEIGNHSWSHAFLPDLRQDQLDRQVRETSAAIHAATGTEPALFRPPYGSRSPQVLTWLSRHEVRIALWDVDAGDWARPGAGQIARRVLAEARPGSIVLMHDGGGDRSQTADALPAVIEGLLDGGYELTTVSGLA